MPLKISFIVVAYNAEAHLPHLLSDLLMQELEGSTLEALLVDSASADGTRGLMQEFAKKAPFAVQVLDNPKKWLASGINVALRAATGDAVIRLDAHARMPKDFLMNNVRALERGENIVGGCVDSAEPESGWPTVMRALDTSRFCGGAAPFRNGGGARYVDTLAYALYRREVYEKVGFYDERLRRTEDNDMHYRMRRAGFKFYYSPDILSFHAARDTLSGQLRQKWGNGLWIGRTLPVQPGCFAPRHLIPAAFVLALMVCLLLLPVTALPLLLLLGAYLAADAVFSVRAALSQKHSQGLTLLALPWLFPLLHVAYGAGTLLGLLTPVKKGDAHA